MASERDIEYGLLADDIAAVFFSEAQRTYREILATKIALRLKQECEKARAEGYAAGKAEREAEVQRLRIKLAAMVAWLERNEPSVWARGMWDGVAEAEVQRLTARIADLEAALRKIASCPDGKSLTWPEIDSICRAALAQKGGA